MDVYLTTTKELNLLKRKSFEVNAKAIYALKLSLNNNYLSRVTDLDSAFTVWNTLISLGEKTTNEKENDSEEEGDTSDMCFMLQGNDSLDVNSEFDFDEDDKIPYDELAMFCQKTS